MASLAPSGCAARSAPAVGGRNPRLGRRQRDALPRITESRAVRSTAVGRIAAVACLPNRWAPSSCRGVSVDAAKCRVKRRVCADASASDDDTPGSSSKEDDDGSPGAPPKPSDSKFADDVAAMTGDVPPNPALALEKQRMKDDADAAELAAQVDERVELPPDTIAPMPEWMYPRQLDNIPTLFGKLNPLTGVLVYYTGAVLRECAGTPLVAAQWVIFVLIPACAALSFLRKFIHDAGHERLVKKSAEKNIPPPPPLMEFKRTQRAAWLDLHLGYAILAPAGAAGGEGASWWLLLAPFFMIVRFLCAKIGFLTQPRRWLTVLGGVASLGALLMSASGTLTQALGGLRGGGYIGYLLAPVTFALVYVFYLAPAALLPGTIARAFRGEGYSKPRRKAVVKDDKATEEEKRAKKWWTVIGVGAMAISVATGSDVPVFVCFFAQLFKADPSKLMQVMIDKGEPARAEMDQAIADKAAGLFKNKDVGDEEAEKDGGSSSTGAKPA